MVKALSRPKYSQIRNLPIRRCFAESVVTWSPLVNAINVYTVYKCNYRFTMFHQRLQDQFDPNCYLEHQDERDAWKRPRWCTNMIRKPCFFCLHFLGVWSFVKHFLLYRIGVVFLLLVLKDFPLILRNIVGSTVRDPCFTSIYCIPTRMIGYRLDFNWLLSSATDWP